MSEAISYFGFIESRKSNIFQLIGLGLLLSFGFVLQYFLGAGIYLACGMLAIGFFCLMVRYPKIWIYTTAISLPFVLWTRDSGLSVSDIVIAVIFQLNIIIWLFWKIIVQRERIIKNFGDWVLILFLVLLLLNYFVSLFNDNDSVLWVREYALMLLMLLYLPIKYYFKEDKDIKLLLICLAIGLTGTVAIHLYEFKQNAIKDAVYAYQLGNSVRLNQTIYYVAIICSICMVFFTKNKITKLGLLFFGFINTLALITSYSRTYWVVLILNFAFLFLFLNLKKKMYAAGYCVLIVIAFIAIVYSIVPKYANIMFEVIEKRFISSGNVKTDPSLKLRYIEYKRAYRQIGGDECKIMYGNGLSKEYWDYENINKTYYLTANIHNGYLSFVYRFGVPLTFLYIIFFIYVSIRSFWLAFVCKDKLLKPLMLASASFFVLLVITDFTSAQFMYKESLVSYAFILGFMEITAERLKMTKNNNSKSIVEINNEADPIIGF